MYDKIKNNVLFNETAFTSCISFPFLSTVESSQLVIFLMPALTVMGAIKANKKAAIIINFFIPKPSSFVVIYNIIKFCFVKLSVQNTYIENYYLIIHII